MRNHIANQIQKLVPRLREYEPIVPKNSTLNELERFIKKQSKQKKPLGRSVSMNHSITFRPSRRQGKQSIGRPHIIRNTVPKRGKENMIVALRAILVYYKSTGIDIAPFLELELANESDMAKFVAPLHDLDIPSLEYELEEISLDWDGIGLGLPFFEMGDEYGSYVEGSFLEGPECVAAMLNDILTDLDHHEPGFYDDLVIDPADQELIGSVGLAEILKFYASCTGETHWYDFQRLENPASFFAEMKKYRGFRIENYYLFADCPQGINISSARDIQIIVDYHKCFYDLATYIPHSWDFMQNIENCIGKHINHFCSVWRENQEKYHGR